MDWCTQVYYCLREDLFYRIRIVAHTLPPLREVREDVPLLVDHFRGFFNHEFGKAVQAVSPETLEALATWNWPGTSESSGTSWSAL